MSFLRRGPATACAIGGSIIAGIALAAAVYIPIAPLLPAEGQSTCFTGSFDGSKELRFGWGLAADEGPAPVLAMNVRIERPPPPEPPGPDSPFHGQPVHGYGFVYIARISADIAGKGAYHAPTACGWVDGPLSHIIPELYCYIDCDGGGVRISRVPGRNALDVIWDGGTHLRMSSCGGGGAYLRAEEKAATFRVSLASADSCDAPVE